MGQYSVRAELIDFRPETRNGIVLRVAERSRIDFALTLGDVREEITVMESDSALRSTTAEVGEVIDNQRVVSLPLNGRRFTDLMLLSDNVVSEPRGTRGAALSQTGATVAIAGQRGGHNMYFLDGVSITDQYFNNLGVSLSVDAIQEFNIQKSIYPAEYGGKASAAISAATKSGGNAVHGSAFEFFRNSALDARNYFNGATKPPLRQNQFGGTVGGPDPQGQDVFLLQHGSAAGAAVAHGHILHAAGRGARWKLRGSCAGLRSAEHGSVARGRARRFRGNQIPVTRLDPIAAAFLQKIPLPNASGNVQNFTATPVSVQRQHAVHRPPRSSTLARRTFCCARFTHSNSETFRPFGSSDLNETLVPGFGTSIATYTRNLAVSHTHIFSPTLIHELRVWGAACLRRTDDWRIRASISRAATACWACRPIPTKIGYPAMNFPGAY